MVRSNCNCQRSFPTITWRGRYIRRHCSQILPTVRSRESFSLRTYGPVVFERKTRSKLTPTTAIIATFDDGCLLSTTIENLRQVHNIMVGEHEICYERMSKCEGVAKLNDQCSLHESHYHMTLLKQSCHVSSRSCLETHRQMNQWRSLVGCKTDLIGALQARIVRPWSLTMRHRWFCEVLRIAIYYPLLQKALLHSHKVH